MQQHGFKTSFHQHAICFSYSNTTAHVLLQYRSTKYNTIIIRKWFMVGIGSGKFLHWSSFSVTGLVGGSLQGWFPFTGLPYNLSAVPGICTGPPPTLDGTSTSSQAHQLAMSLNTILMFFHSWESIDQALMIGLHVGIISIKFTNCRQNCRKFTVNYS